MKILRSFSCLVKIAVKDKVDVVVMILFVAVGFVDLFVDYDFTGGLLFFAIYTLFVLLRMAWWKIKAINHIEDENIRKELMLPEKKEDC